MEEKKLTDEEWFKEYTKNAHSLEEAYSEQLGWGGTTDENVEREIEFDRRLVAYVHRLQAENEELKSPKFASWKIKFFNLKEEFDKELEEHKEFTKKANAEIERLTREKTESAKTAVEVLEQNIELQKQVDEFTGLKTVKTVDRNGLCITFFHKNEEVGKASVCDYQGREDNFLHGVEVKEQYRGQGYGRMIVEYMTTHYPVDTLFVERANSTAIRLYERFGFALTCDTFDKDGKTMAVMARGQELYKKAVKDTAKEIFNEVEFISLRNSNAALLKELEKFIKERYGVEVE